MCKSKSQISLLRIFAVHMTQVPFCDAIKCFLVVRLKTCSFLAQNHIIFLFVFMTFMAQATMKSGCANQLPNQAVPG